MRTVGLNIPPEETKRANRKNRIDKLKKYLIRFGTFLLRNIMDIITIIISLIALSKQ